MQDETELDAGGSEEGFAFEYYMFDWDDNILHMPTRIYLEKKTDEGWIDYPVSTSTFAGIRQDTVNYRPINGDWDDAFIEFYDHGQRGGRAFVEDTMSALGPIIDGAETGGPSITRFCQALVEGRLFAIITARAHSVQFIREGVEYFIARVLTETQREEMIRNLRSFKDLFEQAHQHLTGAELVAKYLDLNKYHGVTSPEFELLIGRKLDGAESPAIAKKLAIRDFVEHAVQQVKDLGFDAPISIGFSDDDQHNIRTVEEFLARELGREFPYVRFVIYDTSDPTIPGGKKIVVRGQLDLGLDGDGI